MNPPSVQARKAVRWFACPLGWSGSTINTSFVLFDFIHVMCIIVYACISKHLIIFIGKEISRFQCCETWWPNMVASSMKSRYPLTACCIPCVFDIFVAYIYIYVQSSTAFFKKDMQTSFVHFPNGKSAYFGNIVFFFFSGGLEATPTVQAPVAESSQAAVPQCSSKRDHRALHLAPKQCHPSSRHWELGASQHVYIVGFYI